MQVWAGGCSPSSLKWPPIFQSKFLHRYFYLANRPPQPWPCYQNSNIIFRQNSYTVKFKVSVVEWQCQNKACVHRPAKEFGNDRKRVREWRQPAECLENAAIYAVANLSVNLDHRVSGGQEKQRQISVKPTSVTVCNIMFLSQHLGVAPEEGAYSRDKMSDPAYKPPLCFQLALRLQNWGRICRTLQYMLHVTCP